MDLFDTLTWAEILVKTTFLGTPTLIVLNCNLVLHDLFSTSESIPELHLQSKIPHNFLTKNLFLA
jgi:hypothetical protein